MTSSVRHLFSSFVASPSSPVYVPSSANISRAKLVNVSVERQSHAEWCSLLWSACTITSTFQVCEIQAQRAVPSEAAEAAALVQWHLFNSDPESDLSAKAAYSVRWRHNSCNDTQTILSPSVPDTLSIRQMNLWNVAEAGERSGRRQGGHLYSVAGECRVSHSASVNNMVRRKWNYTLAQQ